MQIYPYDINISQLRDGATPTSTHAQKGTARPHQTTRLWKSKIVRTMPMHKTKSFFTLSPRRKERDDCAHRDCFQRSKTELGTKEGVFQPQNDAIAHHKPQLLRHKTINLIREHSTICHATGDPRVSGISIPSFHNAAIHFDVSFYPPILVKFYFTLLCIFKKFCSGIFFPSLFH